MAITMIKTWSLGRTIPYDSPWTTPKATEWDATTFENGLDQCFPREGGHFENARTIFQFVSRTPLGIEPTETSLLYFLWYIRSADNLFSLLFFAQDKIVVGGTQQQKIRVKKDYLPNEYTVRNRAVMSRVAQFRVVCARLTEISSLHFQSDHPHEGSIDPARFQKSWHPTQLLLELSKDCQTV